MITQQCEHGPKNGTYLQNQKLITLWPESPIASQFKVKETVKPNPFLLRLVQWSNKTQLYRVKACRPSCVPLSLKELGKILRDNWTISCFELRERKQKLKALALIRRIYVGLTWKAISIATLIKSPCNSMV